MAECKVCERKKVYDLDQAGLWGDAVRRRQSMIVNDYHLACPFAKGTPLGHVAMKRFMSIPCFPAKK